MVNDEISLAIHHFRQNGFPMRIAFFSLLYCLSCTLVAQIPVAELTLKLSPRDEKVLYYGFAEGDQILFSFDETDGKSVKEVEISEYPETSRYREYESKKIKDKSLTVHQKGVYAFRFYNAALLAGRICHINIRRIPARAELNNFNTAVKWVERFDTTWNLVQKTADPGRAFDTISKTRKILLRTDTAAITIIDKTEQIHATYHFGGESFNEVKFELPANEYIPNAGNPYKSTELISWAYWIGAGKEGSQGLLDANKRSALKGIAGTAVDLGLLSSPYAAVIKLALDGISLFSSPPSGDNIRYALSTLQNGKQLILDSGDGVMGFGRVTKVKQGAFLLRLENDNKIDAINVNVKIVAVQLIREYQDETYREVVPASGVQTIKEPLVKISRIPVLE